jgi:hypothetical protein
MAEKHIVFILHGMGQYDETWADKGIKAFKAGWTELGVRPKQVHFVDFDFKQIDYSKVFDGS